MATHEQEVCARLEPMLAGDDSHERAAHAEAVRRSATVVVWTTAAAALETMRLRFGEGYPGDLGPPDFTALEQASRDRASERLEYVMLFGTDYDAQVLLRPGSGSLVFCGSSPAGRELQPTRARISP